MNREYKIFETESGALFFGLLTALFIAVGFLSMEDTDFWTPPVFFCASTATWATMLRLINLATKLKEQPQ